MTTSSPLLLPFMAGSLLAGCTLVTEAQLDQEFRLAPGQSAILAGTDLVVTFREVASDSRCPSQVVCIWAGNGVVTVTVRREGVEEDHTLGTPTGPEEVVSGPYAIRITGLDPEPEEGETIPPGDYRVRLRITLD